MVSGGVGMGDDRWTDSSRDGWMDRVENSVFLDNTVQYVYEYEWWHATSLFSIGANTYIKVLP